MLKLNKIYKISELIKYVGINNNNVINVMKSLKKKTVTFKGQSSSPANIVGEIVDVIHNEEEDEISVHIELYDFTMGFGYLMHESIDKTVAYEGLLYANNHVKLIGVFEIDNNTIINFDNRLKKLENYKYTSLWKKFINFWR